MYTISLYGTRLEVISEVMSKIALPSFHTILIMQVECLARDQLVQPSNCFVPEGKGSLYF